MIVGIEVILWKGVIFIEKRVVFWESVFFWVKVISEEVEVYYKKIGGGWG